MLVSKMAKFIRVKLCTLPFSHSISIMPIHSDAAFMAVSFSLFHQSFLLIAFVSSNKFFGIGRMSLISVFTFSNLF